MKILLLPLVFALYALNTVLGRVPLVARFCGWALTKLGANFQD